MFDFPPSLFRFAIFSKWAAVLTSSAAAQLVCFESFEQYTGGSRVESGGGTVSEGTGLDQGAGWGGPYNVSNAIKSLVKIEDRATSPVNYSNGEITILGGNRALRFYDFANGTYAVQRPLGVVFDAVAGDTLWFSFLFRTNNASPLMNQDFFQVGFDDNSNAAAGIPRVSIGANTTSDSFPADFQFFARSTTAANASEFYEVLPIAAAVTYLLVGRIQANAGIYDSVSLFVNPSSLDDPGPSSASIILPSGLSTLSHAFIRTHALDNGDAYVMDEWHIGRDYGSVVQSLRNALQILPSDSSGDSPVLRWPASLSGVVVLEASSTLAPESWTEMDGPFTLNGIDHQIPVPTGPGITRGFFRLRRW